MRVVIILLISSGLFDTLPSTPDRAIIKPITVPISPKITNVFAMNFIKFILLANLILILEAKLLLELASNPLIFFL